MVIVDFRGADAQTRQSLRFIAFDGLSAHLLILQAKIPDVSARWGNESEG
jgi:hypothetical protein